MYNIIDSNMVLGRSPGITGTYCQSPADILGHMKNMGISMALVHGSLARHSDWRYGNTMLLDEIKEHKELIPCFVAMPDSLMMKGWTDEIERHNIGCFRIFPKSGHFIINCYSLGELARYLEENRKVLFIDFEATGWTSDNVDWNGVMEICKKFPLLPVILTGITITSPRNYRRILGEFSNLYLEVSKLYCPGEIKNLCASGFAGRLIWGSGMPYNFSGGMLSMLRNETIAHEDACKILGDNIVKLLSIDKSSIPNSPYKEVRKSEIIDLHVHHGGWNQSTAPMGQADDILENMDRCGVQKAVITSLWACYGNIQKGNEAVAELCLKFPGRFFGYMTVDPKHPDEIHEQILLYGNNKNFRGFKFHCDLHCASITDKGYEKAFNFANAHSWFILVHWRWDDDVKIWESLCSRYPRVKFIVAHVGAGYHSSKMHMELALLCKNNKNLFLDLTASAIVPGFLEKLVEWAGAEQIIYGSDYPLFDMGYEIGRVTYSNLTQGEKNLILHDNAMRILIQC